MQIHILHEQRNYICNTLRELTRIVPVGDADTSLFYAYQLYFYFQYHPLSGQLKMFQKLSFILLSLQLEKLNLTM